MTRTRYPKVNYARNRRRVQWSEGAEVGVAALALERGEEEARRRRLLRDEREAYRNDPTVRR